MVPVREDYRDYKPPAWVGKTVRNLLDSLSERHVGGLSAIVLTESALIPKGRTRRVAGKRYAMKECFGFYYRRTSRTAAVVFLVVDNIIDARPPRYWRIPFFRQFDVGTILFHEIGHHLNHTGRSVGAGQEASAIEWQRRLSRMHFQTKYWYLRPVAKPLRLIWGWLGQTGQRQRAASLSHRVAH